MYIRIDTVADRDDISIMISNHQPETWMAISMGWCWRKMRPGVRCCILCRTRSSWLLNSRSLLDRHTALEWLDQSNPCCWWYCSTWCTGTHTVGRGTNVDNAMVHRLCDTSPLPLLEIELLMAACATSINKGKMMAQESRPRLTFHARICCLPFLRKRALAWVQ